MTMKRWDGSSQIDLTIAKRWDGTAFVDLTIAKRWDGTQFVDITLPGGGGIFSASISPGFANGLVISSSGVTFANVTSNAVTATVLGGVGPFTFDWIKVSGDSAVLPTADTEATTQFSAMVPRNNQRVATYKCRVTDTGTDEVIDVTLANPVTLIHETDA